MRWSFEELFFTLRLYKESNFWLWIKHFPKNFWKRFKAIMFWLSFGYTMESIKRTNEFLDFVILERMKFFRNVEKTKYPSNVSSVREWEEVIDETIELFERMVDNYYIDIPEDKLEPKYTDLGNDQFQVEFNFTEEEQKEYGGMLEIQRDNDIKALGMFATFYQHFWEF